MIMGTTFIIAGFIGMSFSHNSTLTMLCFSLGHGFGNAVSFMAPIICAWSYFPRRKGMAGGIVIAGVGIGGFIYSIASTAFINPKNLTGDIIVMDGTD